MATLTYAYAPGATVYHINRSTGIKAGVVKSVNIQIKYGNTSIVYDIAFVVASDGYVQAEENVLFPTADTALAAYKLQFLS